MKLCRRIFCPKRWRILGCCLDHFFNRCHFTFLFGKFLCFHCTKTGHNPLFQFIQRLWTSHDDSQILRPIVLSMKCQESFANSLQIFWILGWQCFGVSCCELGKVMFVVRQSLENLESSSSIRRQVFGVLRVNSVDLPSCATFGEERRNKKVAKDVNRAFSMLCQDLEFVGRQMKRRGRIGSSAVLTQVFLVFVFARILFASEEAHMLSEMCNA
mmetsp:Transcript_25146/g.57782  ORF Transcript_25146/g.57782 Transcript_25146/m.57782 type:complete len:214 (-) Transcript_25146:9-650(-)